MVNSERFFNALDAYLINEKLDPSVVEDGLKGKLLSWLEEKESKFLEICDGDMIGYTQNPFEQVYFLGFERRRHLDDAENFKAFMEDKFDISFELGKDMFTSYNQVNGSDLFIRNSRTEYKRDRINKSNLIPIKYLGYLTYWQEFEINDDSGKLIDRIYLTSTGIVIPDLNVINEINNGERRVIVDNDNNYIQSEHRLSKK